MRVIESAETLRFESADLDQFSLASGDRNPLHCDRDYARRTPYGEPVAFGMLGAIACLGTSRRGSDRRLKSIACHFRAPLYTGIDYRVELASDADDAFEARIVDGRRVVLDVKAAFEPRTASRDSAPLGVGPQIPRTDARRLVMSELEPGASVHGEYAPNWPEVRILGQRTGIDRGGLDVADVGALLMLSYIVGMEIPGERALFSTVDLHFDAGRPQGANEFGFEVEPVTVDARINRITANVELTVEGSHFGAGELVAFVRDEVPPVDVSELRGLLPGAPGLLGTNALVVGGSRGLGAAIVHALSLSGSDAVFAYERSREAAETVVRTAPGPGAVTAVRGDAADPEWCRTLAEDIVSRHGGLDVLVCNACPSFGPLDVHPTTVDRILDHVSRSVELTAVPISASLDALALRGGTVAVISSSYAATPPAEWPHYVAGKRAIEGFVEVAARQRRDVAFLVVRPPKLVTDLTNTPLGRAGAIAPEVIAAAIAARLADDRRPEEPVELMETFDCVPAR